MKNIKILILVVLTVGINLVESTGTSFNGKPECSNANFWCQNFLTAKRCNAIDYCIQSVWSPQISAPSDSNFVCDVCQSWVAKARITLEDNQIDIMGSLQPICDFIPVRSFQDRCVDFASNAASIMKMIQSDMDPSMICSNLFLCNNHLINDALKEISATKCVQCQMFENLLEQNLANSYQDIILEKLLSICGEMSSYNDSCRTIVMTYFDDMYGFMKSHIKLELICDSSCQRHENNELDVFEMLDKENDQTQETREEFEPQGGMISHRSRCSLCKRIVEFVESQNKSKTKEEVMKSFEESCDSEKFKRIKIKCKKFIHEYSEKMVDFIMQGLKPDILCGNIHVCRKTDMPDYAGNDYELDILMTAEEMDEPLETEEIGEPLEGVKRHECTICEGVVKIIEHYIRHKTDDQIRHELEKLCNRLPNKQKCIEYIDKYSDEIIKLMKRGVNSKAICHKMHICAEPDFPNYRDINYESDMLMTSEEINKPQEENMEVSLPQCTLCKSMVKTVEKLFHHKSRGDILWALDKLCEHSLIKSICLNFVHKHSETIIKLIEKGIGPSMICHMMKLCFFSEMPQSQEYDYEDHSLKRLMKASEEETDELQETEKMYEPLQASAHEIRLYNHCPFAVWPGILNNPNKALPLNGGFRLDAYKTRSFSVGNGWGGRVWARTECNEQTGHCVTGDCGRIQCHGAGGVPPVSLAEITFDGAGGIDYYDISLVDGYNLPIKMEPIPGTYRTRSGGPYDCKPAGCNKDLNAICPKELAMHNSRGWKVACKSACEAFRTDQYCCRGAYNTPKTCKSTNWPVNYPAIFKKACPTAYSYAYDDQTSTFTCKGNPVTGYTVTFCP